ncbi:MAG: hypothetical protein WC783_00680 [Candidatus Paceibacterota bacterium]|jgi:hypothetical protein
MKPVVYDLANRMRRLIPSGEPLENAENNPIPHFADRIIRVGIATSTECDFSTISAAVAAINADTFGWGAPSRDNQYLIEVYLEEIIENIVYPTAGYTTIRGMLTTSNVGTDAANPFMGNTFGCKLIGGVAGTSVITGSPNCAMENIVFKVDSAGRGADYFFSLTDTVTVATTVDTFTFKNCISIGALNGLNGSNITVGSGANPFYFALSFLNCYFYNFVLGLHNWTINTGASTGINVLTIFEKTIFNCGIVSTGAGNLILNATDSTFDSFTFNNSTGATNTLTFYNSTIAQTTTLLGDDVSTFNLYNSNVLGTITGSHTNTWTFNAYNSVLSGITPNLTGTININQYGGKIGAINASNASVLNLNFNDLRCDQVTLDGTSSGTITSKRCSFVGLTTLTTTGVFTISSIHDTYVAGLNWVLQSGHINSFDYCDFIDTFTTAAAIAPVVSFNSCNFKDGLDVNGDITASIYGGYISNIDIVGAMSVTLNNAYVPSCTLQATSSGTFTYSNTYIPVSNLGSALVTPNDYIFTRATANNADYVIKTTDFVVEAINMAAAHQITLPDAGDSGAGRIFVITDRTGNAATYNITVIGTAGELIDGSASYVINKNRGSIIVASDGTSSWKIIAKDNNIVNSIVEVADAAHVATWVYDTILYTSLTATRNVTLPSPTGMSGRSITVTDGTGNAEAYPIVVLPNAAETILGETSASLNAERISVTFYTNGTNWYVR